MGVIWEVIQELGSMFFGTPRLAIPLLIVIALAAAVAHFANPQMAGGLLLGGCLAVLAENVFYAARQARK